MTIILVAWKTHWNTKPCKYFSSLCRAVAVYSDLTVSMHTIFVSRHLYLNKFIVTDIHAKAPAWKRFL